MALFNTNIGVNVDLPIESNHGVFNTSYIDISNMSPVGNGVGFFNVESYNTLSIQLSGAGEYSDITVYGYDEELHVSTQLTSQASVDISNYNYVLVRSNAGTQVSFS